MLDLKHPMTRHIFDAAYAESAILTTAKAMTVACRRGRVRLRDGRAPTFEELRRLAHDHFANRRAIPPAIDALEQALTELTELPGVLDDGPSAEYKCPACGADLKRLGKYGFPEPDNPTDIYCGPCLEIVMPPILTLRSLRVGFGTDAI